MNPFLVWKIHGRVAATLIIFPKNPIDRELEGYSLWESQKSQTLLSD